MHSKISGLVWSSTSGMMQHSSYTWSAVISAHMNSWRSVGLRRLLAPHTSTAGTMTNVYLVLWSSQQNINISSAYCLRQIARYRSVGGRRQQQSRRATRLLLLPVSGTHVSHSVGVRYTQTVRTHAEYKQCSKHQYTTPSSPKASVYCLINQVHHLFRIGDTTGLCDNGILYLNGAARDENWRRADCIRRAPHGGAADVNRQEYSSARAVHEALW